MFDCGDFALRRSHPAVMTRVVRRTRGPCEDDVIDLVTACDLKSIPLDNLVKTWSFVIREEEEHVPYRAAAAEFLRRRCARMSGPHIAGTLGMEMARSRGEAPVTEE